MRVVILDTGCANLLSLARAVSRLGIDPEVTRDPKLVKAADRVFLPGVGTARAAMAELEKRELPDLIRSLSQPVLGICLGEQLLAKRSEETGGVDMLGLIPAEVRELRVGSLPLPHMGWNRVFPDDSPMAKHLFKGLPAGEWFYFVHSYAMPLNEGPIARAEYGAPFTAAAARDNFAGVQFHPERSGKAGARLLANFLGVEL